MAEALLQTSLAVRRGEVRMGALTDDRVFIRIPGARASNAATPSVPVPPPSCEGFVNQLPGPHLRAAHSRLLL